MMSLFNCFFSELTLKIDKLIDLILALISSNSDEAFSFERITKGWLTLTFSPSLIRISSTIPPSRC